MSKHNWMKSHFNERGQHRAEQDLSSYLDYAHDSRSQAKSLFANQKTNYRSFAIIPDIIAIDILTKYKVDVHDPQNGAEEMELIRKIIINYYPQLLTGNIIKNPKGV